MPAFCMASEKDIPGGWVLGAVFRGQPHFVSAGESYGVPGILRYVFMLLTHNGLCNALFVMMHL